MIKLHNECPGCGRLDGEQVSDDCWLCQVDDNPRESHPQLHEHQMVASSDGSEARS